jgi:hypothetical protein
MLGDWQNISFCLYFFSYGGEELTSHDLARQDEEEDEVNYSLGHVVLVMTCGGSDVLISRKQFGLALVRAVEAPGARRHPSRRVAKGVIGSL